MPYLDPSDRTAKKERLPHSVVLEDGKRLLVKGAHDLLRFDEEGAEIALSLERLTVEGKALKLEGFDTEQNIVSISGKILLLEYEEEEEVKGANNKRFSGKR